MYEHYTISVNLAALPGISVPCGSLADGLPREANRASLKRARCCVGHAYEQASGVKTGPAPSRDARGDSRDGDEAVIGMEVHVELNTNQGVLRVQRISAPPTPTCAPSASACPAPCRC